jgi:hypothetical protein
VQYRCIQIWFISRSIQTVRPPATFTCWLCFDSFELAPSMELSSTLEADSRSAYQEIPRILWNPKVNYRVYKSAPPVPVLSHMNPIHNIPPQSLKIFFILSFHLRLGLPSDLLLSDFPTKILYTFLFCPVIATCHAVPWFDHFDVRWRIEIMNLHHPVTSFLLGPNILLSTLFSNTLSLCSSLNARYEVSHQYKTSGKIEVFYFIMKK